jgi:hypothetical protein
VLHGHAPARGPSACRARPAGPAAGGTALRIGSESPHHLVGTGMTTRMDGCLPAERRPGPGRRGEAARSASAPRGLRPWASSESAAPLPRGALPRRRTRTRSRAPGRCLAGSRALSESPAGADSEIAREME